MIDKNNNIITELICDRWKNKDMEKYFDEKSVGFKTELLFDLMPSNFLYYEVHRYINFDGTLEGNRVLKNENVLHFKPKTNSSGVWGFTHNTKSRSYNLVVDQYWIDINKVDKDTINENTLSDIIDAMSRIVKQL